MRTQRDWIASCQGVSYVYFGLWSLEREPAAVELDAHGLVLPFGSLGRQVVQG